MKPTRITRRKLQEIDRRLASIHSLLTARVSNRLGRGLSTEDWESAETVMESVRCDLALLTAQRLPIQPGPDPDLKVWTIHELMALRKVFGLSQN